MWGRGRGGGMHAQRLCTAQRTTCRASVFSFHHVGPRIKLGFADLVAGVCILLSHLGSHVAEILDSWLLNSEHRFGSVRFSVLRALYWGCCVRLVLFCFVLFFDKVGELLNLLPPVFLWCRGQTQGFCKHPTNCSKSPTLCS